MSWVPALPGELIPFIVDVVWGEEQGGIGSSDECDTNYRRVDPWSVGLAGTLKGNSHYAVASYTVCLDVVDLFTTFSSFSFQVAQIYDF